VKGDRRKSKKVVQDAAETSADLDVLRVGGHDTPTSLLEVAAKLTRQTQVEALVSGV
jgi:hypothetical protein